MACRLFGVKLLCEPIMTFCQLDHKEHISKQIYLKFKISIPENAFQNIVCERRTFCVGLNVFYVTHTLHVCIDTRCYQDGDNIRMYI